MIIARHLLAPERALLMANVSKYLASEAFFNCDDYESVSGGA
jgi:hypothetical protein